MSGGVQAGRTLAMGQDEAVGGGRQSVEAPFGRALARLGQSRPDIVGLTADQVDRVYRDIEQKRRATRYLHARPQMVEPIEEVAG